MRCPPRCCGGTVALLRWNCRATSLNARCAQAAERPALSAERAPSPRPLLAQSLRREVDKKEAALQAARLTLLEAERQLKASEKRTAPDACAFDAVYGWNRRFAGSYVEEDRPEGLPPTPAGAITLGLRNFANELNALTSSLRGDRSEEFKGQEDETVRHALTNRPAPPQQPTDRLVPLLAVQAGKMREKLSELTLSNDDIWEREYSRPQIKCVACSAGMPCAAAECCRRAQGAVDHQGPLPRAVLHAGQHLQRAAACAPVVP